MRETFRKSKFFQNVSHASRVKVKQKIVFVYQGYRAILVQPAEIDSTNKV